MPLEFASGGVVAEHNAVRNAVGVFDVSHLGTAIVRGPKALVELNQIFTNNLSLLSDGDAQYNLLLTDEAGVIDDLIVYRVSDDEAILVPNAANSAEVLQALRQSLPPSVSQIDLHEQMAILAIQGPHSPKVLAQLGLPHQMPYMSFVSADDGVTVARTGYTGEIGYEVMIAVEDAPNFWTRALAACKSLGGLPAGLGARDTLRTEMGYALHGHEISKQIDPVTAGLSWAIAWDKPRFYGREALLARRDGRDSGSTDYKLVGLRAKDRAVLRRGMNVRAQSADPEGHESIGEITSGTFSPTLGAGIALALVTQQVQEGSEVFVDVRGRKVACQVVRTPLVERNPRALIAE
jgi:aminomethyltransferase